jgi:hypothetical protein
MKFMMAALPNGPAPAVAATLLASGAKCSRTAIAAVENCRTNSGADRRFQRRRGADAAYGLAPIPKWP